MNVYLVIDDVLHDFEHASLHVHILEEAIEYEPIEKCSQTSF